MIPPPQLRWSIPKKARVREPSQAFTLVTNFELAASRGCASRASSVPPRFLQVARSLQDAPSAPGRCHARALAREIARPASRVFLQCCRRSTSLAAARKRIEVVQSARWLHGDPRITIVCPAFAGPTLSCHEISARKKARSRREGVPREGGPSAPSSPCRPS